MKLLFDRLHHWLARHAPAVLADLRPGASEDDIVAAEAAMWNLGKELYEQDQRYSFWRPHWIPLLFDGVQLLHFDTQADQVIDAWEDDDYVTESFAWLLEEFIDDLEAGHDWVRETPVNIEDIIQQRLL